MNSRSSDEENDGDSSEPPQPESHDADAVNHAVNENDLELLLLRRIDPLVFCQYCGQYPADFKCYDCRKTNYCSIECWDVDYADHTAACAILQLSRGDLACRG